MQILKQRFFKKRKQQMYIIHKKLIATTVGHAPWGLGVAEHFYNLYEYPDGRRENEEFYGDQDYDMPENTDFSTKAQVKAWIYRGDLPRSVLSCEPLIGEVNRKIQRQGQGTLIYKVQNESERGCSQEDLEAFKKLLEKISKKECSLTVGFAVSGKRWD
ncbi:hypothetical protein HNQ69_001222 [Bartonella callosciuri]|uniref:Uncharacterized protein n=1 Tax=Bartonella callosciuri TaxID=686223 RepID=A0A840NUK0_9HYPH|nr:hypothetical protein [Bartonella callosciuri]MBB5074088.1 hypothetical protein [Bartonella callosciuri]